MAMTRACCSLLIVAGGERSDDSVVGCEKSLTWASALVRISHEMIRAATPMKNNASPP